MKVFTDEELTQMGRRTLDVLTEAIESGDIEKSKKLARRMHREFQSMHDLLCNTVTAFASYVGRTYGEDAVAEATRAVYSDSFKALLKIYKGKSYRDTVAMLVAGVRGHLSAIKLEEDDEKVTLMPDPCPSGGRIARGETGYTDYLRLSKPAMVTFGMTDFPVFCTHCPMDDLLFIEWLGYPIFTCEPPSKIGDKPCRVHVYKDPNKIPESVYTRVGKKKPASFPVNPYNK